MKKIVVLLLLLPIFGFAQTFNGMVEKELINYVISFSLPTDPDNTVYYTLNNNNKYLISYSNSDATINNSNKSNVWWIDDTNSLNILHDKIQYSIPSNSNGFGRWYNSLTASTGILTFIEISKRLLSSSIKNYVEEKINEWQKKDEFEKLAQYQLRVTKNTRNQQINLYQKEAIDLFKQEAIASFDTSKIELQKYDSENETFLLKISDTESFLLPVPINSARSFSDAYNPKWFSNIDMVIKEGRFILSHIEYIIYAYDITDNNSYAVTTFDYNFDEIEIDIKQSDLSNTTITKNKTIRVGNSIVDSDIPENKKVANRYALVIGNQDYTSYQRTLSSEQNVDYAENDATIFKQYCLNTLGVKQENMHFLLNATAGQMSQEIDLVSKIVSKLGPEAELIVYYAGHGYPDELTKVPYLIPVDVSASNLNSAIKLSDVYKKLSSTNAGKISVFLDACFTGGGRTSGLIASRGVKIRPKKGALSGNMIVFSASSSDQSSLPYHKEAHGMFTFHLLKKLQETMGAVNMGALSDYLIDKVSLQSLKENKKEQDPSTNASQEVSTQWRNWKF
jgi:hypothetical protein